METIKCILNFCNAAVFYDYKNIGFIDEFNQARKCITNNFQETIPVSRKLITLSIIDVVILKLYDNNVENVIEINHDLRANIKHLLSFQKVVKEEVDKAME